MSTESASASELPQRTTFRHALTGQLYEVFERGRIRVSDQQSGKWGMFNERGKWLEGELTFADPHLCGWIDHKSSEASFVNPLAGYTKNA